MGHGGMQNVDGTHAGGNTGSGGGGGGATNGAYGYGGNGGSGCVIVWWNE